MDDFAKLKGRALRTAWVLKGVFKIPATFDALARLTVEEVDSVKGIGPVKRRELSYALAEHGVEWLADMRSYKARTQADHLRACAKHHREVAGNLEELAQRIEDRSGLVVG